MLVDIVRMHFQEILQVLVEGVNIPDNVVR